MNSNFIASAAARAQRSRIEILAQNSNPEYFEYFIYILNHGTQGLLN